MGSSVAESHPIIALFGPYNPHAIDFHAVLLLLQQNQKYKAGHILAHKYLPRSYIPAWTNGKAGRCFRKEHGRFQVAA
jgi:hypothetical protein